MDNRTIFARNLNYQMDLHEKSRQDVSTDLGISYFTITSWANGTKYPRMDKITKLAEYFGVLVSDLIEEKKEQSTEYDGLSKKKQAFIDKVMQMSDVELDRLEQILALVENTTL
jgi:repressor LexA